MDFFTQCWHKLFIILSPILHLVFIDENFLSSFYALCSGNFKVLIFRLCLYKKKILWPIIPAEIPGVKREASFFRRFLLDSRRNSRGGTRIIPSPAQVRPENLLNAYNHWVITINKFRILWRVHSHFATRSTIKNCCTHIFKAPIQILGQTQCFQ